MRNKAVIIGYSGHAYVVLDILLANHYQIRGYCDRDFKDKNPYNLRYLGHEDDIEADSILKESIVFVGIGNNILRKQITEELLSRSIHLPPISHPSAIISPYVQILASSVIMPGVIINAEARIGIGTICNTASIIEHECQIGSFVHIAPGATLLGNIKIGDNTFIGANAVIKQGVRIGNNVIVGAGSVITKNIGNDQIVYGNPGKVKAL